MFVRALVGRSSRILLSGRRLIAKPSTGTRWWSVLSATTRTVSQKPFMGGLCACSKMCACGAHKITQGDQDLLGFLSDEIRFEKDSSKPTPSIDSFNVKSDGTVVTLEREINGEKVVITFDINQNINEDDAYISGEESDDEKSNNLDDAVQAGNIVSYPYFTVDITKQNGKTLRFTCEYNQGVVAKTEDAGDEEDELFQVINISVMSSPDAGDSKGLYAAETENLDPNLYTMLLNMLAERGVDSGFAQRLLEYSTALEHQHYIKFLEDLEKFIKQN